MATRVKLAPRDTLFRKALRQLRIAAVFGLTALASNCSVADLSHLAGIKTVWGRGFELREPSRLPAAA